MIKHRLIYRMCMYACTCVRNIQLLVKILQKNQIPLKQKLVVERPKELRQVFKCFDPVMKTTRKLFTLPFKNPINGSCSF